MTMRRYSVGVIWFNEAIETRKTYRHFTYHWQMLLYMLHLTTYRIRFDSNSKLLLQYGIIVERCKYNFYAIAVTRYPQKNTYWLRTFPFTNLYFQNQGTIPPRAPRLEPTTYHTRCEHVDHCIGVSEISLKMVFKTHIPTFKPSSTCNVLMKYIGFVNYKLFSTMPDHSPFHSIYQYVKRCRDIIRKNYNIIFL